MKIALKMTGCKNNRYELDQILLWAAKNGMEITTNEEEADYCIINTCTVTHVADKKSRQLVRKTKHSNQKTKTIVFGCAARMQKDQFEKINEIDHLAADVKGVIQVLKNEIKKNPGNLKSKSEKLAPCMAQIDHPGLFRSRALVQIQDGCDNYCSYCIIAAARGKSVNRSSQEIIDEINEYHEAGFNEAVLTGINIGAYGASMTIKPEEARLFELLSEILAKTNIPRIRLSSMNPEFFDERLYKVLANPRICRHIHLSIQSGCDSVLEKMRRPYTAQHMAEVIKRLKADIPGMAISSDIIVGFPGETKENFEETMNFVKQNPLAKIHAFPYSIRQNTVASKMKQIPFAIKKDRNRRLNALGDEQRKEFIQGQIGQKATVIWEKRIESGVMEGLTDHYIRVREKSRAPIRSIEEVVLTEKNIILN